MQVNYYCNTQGQVHFAHFSPVRRRSTQPPFNSCLGDATRRLDTIDVVHALDAQVNRAITLEAVAFIHERRRTGGASAWPHASHVVAVPFASARGTAAAPCPYAHCIRKDSRHDLTHPVDVQ